MFRAAVLTVSDKGFSGERADGSGVLIAEILKANGFIVERYEIVPDEKETISQVLIEMCDVGQVDLVITTGGTGFSRRDVTPEATLDVIERHVPGIPEAMRSKSLEITPKAMLSRGVAGIRKGTLIVNMPGSPKAVAEYLDILLPVLPHALSILTGQAVECARPLL